MISFEDQAAAIVAAHHFFQAEKPIWLARAPGRLDLMGGNVDYTGGMVLQGLLQEAVWVAAQPREDDRICILNPGAAQFGWKPRIECRDSSLHDLESLRLFCRQDKNSRWCGYVLGALHYLKKRYALGHSKGLNLSIASEIPPNKGVSSSAALEVATLKAASAAWEVSLDGIALATAGQWVENVVVGSACGIMDQAAIVLGRENHLLPMLCQPCLPSSPIPLPEDIRIWGIDSMASRATNSAAYETARAAAFMGYKLICLHEGIETIPEPDAEIPRWTDSRWNGYLSNLAPSDFRAKYERWLPESLSGREFLLRAGEHVDPFTSIDPDREYPVRGAARYATEENLRVRMIAALLDSAPSKIPDCTLHLIGEILCQSHTAYSECGLGSEACDQLVSLARDAGFAGAKMTGGGAGGVVAVLGRSGDESALKRMVQEYASMCGSMPHIFQGSSNGADAFAVRALQLPSGPGIP